MALRATYRSLTPHQPPARGAEPDLAVCVAQGPECVDPAARDAETCRPLEVPKRKCPPTWDRWGGMLAGLARAGGGHTR